MRSLWGLWLTMGALFLSGCVTGGGEDMEAPVIEDPSLSHKAPSLPVKKLHPSSQDVRHLPRDLVLRVLDEGPQPFISGIDVEPVFHSGKFFGWRLISFWSESSRYEGALVRVGDIILGVNGIPIERPEDVMGLWTSLRTAEEIRIELIRGGARRVVIYRIDP